MNKDISKLEEAKAHLNKALEYLTNLRSINDICVKIIDAIDLIEKELYP